jgi:hypothetical protein
MAALATAVLACSCETTMDSLESDAERRADARAEKRVSGKSGVYHGTSFDVTIPAEMKTNVKKTEREVVHYFFTPEMASRKVGMGIYEGVAAKSMVRLRKDLIEEESSPSKVNVFIGNVQRGVTFGGKRWSEYFLFPKDGNFSLQIWWFDVEPEDEAVFREIIHTLRGTYPRKDVD